jgi:predicted nuclease of predicted toxin-antitoxin system
MDWPEFLANENVPAPLLRLLRDEGLVVHAVGDLMPSASDSAVLRHAHKHSLWLLTFDRDYGELVFAGKAPAPPAILYLRQDPLPMSRLADTVLAALEEHRGTARTPRRCRRATDPTARVAVCVTARHDRAA